MYFIFGWIEILFVSKHVRAAALQQLRQYKLFSKLVNNDKNLKCKYSLCTLLVQTPWWRRRRIKWNPEAPKRLILYLIYFWPIIKSNIFQWLKGTDNTKKKRKKKSSTWKRITTEIRQAVIEKKMFSKTWTSVKMRGSNRLMWYHSCHCILPTYYTNNHQRFAARGGKYWNPW